MRAETCPWVGYVVRKVGEKSPACGGGTGPGTYTLGVRSWEIPGRSSSYGNGTRYPDNDTLLQDENAVADDEPSTASDRSVTVPGPPFVVGGPM